MGMKTARDKSGQLFCPTSPPFFKASPAFSPGKHNGIVGFKKFAIILCLRNLISCRVRETPPKRIFDVSDLFNFCASRSGMLLVCNKICYLFSCAPPFWPFVPVKAHLFHL